jgi:Coenzyme PQQ synthesis protein D (PqqD)
MNEPQIAPFLDLATKVLASKDVLGAELGGEVSLLNVKSGIYFTLNPVGASVWRQIQEMRSLAEIKQQLLAEYDVDAQRCESDLRQLITELQTLGLIELIAA